MPKYMVRVGEGPELAVEATNQQAATNYVLKDEIAKLKASAEVRLMTMDDAMEIGKQGGKIFKMTDELPSQAETEDASGEAE